MTKNKVKFVKQTFLTNPCNILMKSQKLNLQSTNLISTIFASHHLWGIRSMWIYIYPVLRLLQSWKTSFTNISVWLAICRSVIWRRNNCWSNFLIRISFGILFLSSSLARLLLLIFMVPAMNYCYYYNYIIIYKVVHLDPATRSTTVEHIVIVPRWA